MTRRLISSQAVQAAEDLAAGTITQTTTNIESTTVTIDDKNIELGATDSPTDVTADGGGITLKGATDKTILWENDDDSWHLNQTVVIDDGDMEFKPTTISTAHIKVPAGSLDIRCANNLKIGTDGADSIRIGRDNSTAAKVHIRSGDDTDLVVSNSKVGIGTDSPAHELDVDGDVRVSGDIILNDGGSLKEAGGTAAITFDGSGHVTKIGQDSPSSADVLTYDGSKWVAEAPTTGDITGVTAGVGLSGGGTSGGVTLTLDLSELSAVTPTATDSFATLDSDGANEQRTTITALSTLQAGTASSTGLSASSGVLSVSDLHPVGVDGSANQLITDDGDGTVTSEAKALVDGAKLTIGNGTAEDAMLAFDGNAQDFHVALDDNVDDLVIGVGMTAGTTTAIAINENAQVSVVDAFAANVAGSFGTFGSSDTTPSVATGNLWKTHASTQTLSMFDDGIAGQTIHVISTAAVTFDVTSTNLKGGSTDLVTASGDTTSWFFDGTNWYLIAFHDVSADLSEPGGGGGASLANDANNRITTATGSGGINGEANLTFDGSTLDLNGNLDVDATGAIELLSTYASAGAVSLTVQPGASGTNDRAMHIRADNCTGDEAIKMQCDEGGIELECGNGKAFTFDSAGGDCYQELQLNGTGAWSIGVDDSDGDKFKINSGSSGLEDDSDFSMDSSGNAEFGGIVTMEGLATTTRTLSGNHTVFDDGAGNPVGDHVLLVGGAHTITLPANRDAGSLVVVKNTASSGNVTVTSSDNIDGDSGDVTIQPDVATTFVSDGANWFIIGEYGGAGE